MPLRQILCKRALCAERFCKRRVQGTSATPELTAWSFCTQVAIKKVLQDKRFKNRELQIMKMMGHPNVVDLKHCFYTNTDKDEVCGRPACMQLANSEAFRSTPLPRVDDKSNEPLSGRSSEALLACSRSVLISAVHCEACDRHCCCAA